MEPPTPPKITGVEVEAAEPNEADSLKIARISSDTNRSMPEVAQVVKVRLSAKPPATSMAWRLYVDDVLIPKYWEYEDGIYFTVLDPQFFADHKGEPLRFSQDGVDFFETGVKLPALAEPVADLGLKRQAAKRKATKATKKKATKSSKSKKR